MAFYKYLVIKVNGNPTPIIFHPVISHKDIFESLKNNKITDEVISAGIVSVIGQNEFEIMACGDSVTLAIGSKSEDAQLIKSGLDAYL
jgi:hypothetical protein